MFSALEVKTCYSILESLNKIDKLIDKAKELGYSSLAITDVNNMFGAYEFYLAAKKAGIKPIIGMEVRDSNDRFILLAKNNNGYKNLIKLATILSERNVTREELMSFSSDLILIMPYDSYNKNIVSIYEEHYVGYTKSEERINTTGDEIFINDVSYIEKNDFKYIDYTFMIRDDKRLGEVELGKYKGKYLLSRDEFDSVTSEEVRKNMEAIVNSCNVVMEYQKGLLPVYDENINPFEYSNGVRRTPFEGILRLRLRMSVGEGLQEGRVCAIIKAWRRM